MSVDIDGPAMELDAETAQMSNISCADITPDDTSCTFYITEDGDYSVMFTESNEIGSTTTSSLFDCEYTFTIIVSVCACTRYM